MAFNSKNIETINIRLNIIFRLSLPFLAMLEFIYWKMYLSNEFFLKKYFSNKFDSKILILILILTEIERKSKILED